MTVGVSSLILAIAAWASPAVGARIDPSEAILFAALFIVPIFGFMMIFRQKIDAIREGRVALAADPIGIEFHDWRGTPFRLSWSDVDSLRLHRDNVLFFEGSEVGGPNNPARLNVNELDIDGRALLDGLKQVSSKPAVYRGELL